MKLGLRTQFRLRKSVIFFRPFPPFLVDNTVRRMSLFLKVSIRATGNSCSKLIRKKKCPNFQKGGSSQQRCTHTTRSITDLGAVLWKLGRHQAATQLVRLETSCDITYLFLKLTILSFIAIW